MVLASKTKKIFDGRYEIIGIVGRGSRSVVYHARHAMVPSSEVALKVLMQKKDTQPNSERLRKEALAMVSARHKYVIRLDDFHSVGDLCYLAMEYAPERDLRVYAKNFGGKLPIAQAEIFLAQAAEGLNFIHKAGIIHRDIKPENILVIDDKQLRIADFGVALLPGDPSSIQELKTGVGTFDYMAPEILEGKEFTQACDIYALGVCFYEIISGKNPFKDVNMSRQIEVRRMRNIPELKSLVPEIPQYLSEAIMRAMSFEPTNRFSSSQEIVQLLNLHKGRKNIKPIETPHAKEQIVENVIEETKIAVNSDLVSGSQISNKETSKANLQIDSKIEKSPAALEILKQLEKVKSESIPQTKTVGKITPPATPKIENKNQDLKPQDSLVKKTESAERIVNPNLEKTMRETLQQNLQQTSQQKSANSDQAESARATSETQSKPDQKESYTPKVDLASKASNLSSTVQQATEPKSDPELDIEKIGVNKTVLINRETVEKIRAESKKRETRSVQPRAGLSKRTTAIILAVSALVILLAAQFTANFRRDKLDKLKPKIELTSLEQSSSPIPVFNSTELSFPKLAQGLYSGVIEDLVPQRELPLTIISLPNKLVVIIGIEGWTPSVIPVEKLEQADRLKVAANGMILDFTGKADEGEIIGFFRNIVNGQQGKWRAKPVK